MRREIYNTHTFDYNSSDSLWRINQYERRTS